MKDNIERLITEEQVLRKALSENLERQKEYYTAEFCENNGINIGDTIRFKEGRSDVTGVVARFEYWGVKVAYPIVSLFNKDGSVGKREKRCWTSNLESVEIIKKG